MGNNVASQFSELRTRLNEWLITFCRLFDYDVNQYSEFRNLLRKPTRQINCVVGQATARKLTYVNFILVIYIIDIENYVICVKQESCPRGSSMPSRLE